MKISFLIPRFYIEVMKMVLTPFPRLEFYERFFFRYRTKDAPGVSPARHRKQKPYPKELRKVCVAIVFVFCNFVATGASLAVVHEYYPLVEPLPGKTGQ
jgi:hypothetical protein